jgi:Proline racemase
MASYSSVKVIDSHTAGEPTRVVIDGGPDLGRGTLTERLTCFRERYDFFRSGVVNEPRRSDVVVGAILLEPFDLACDDSRPRPVAAAAWFNKAAFVANGPGQPGGSDREERTATRHATSSAPLDIETSI